MTTETARPAIRTSAIKAWLADYLHNTLGVPSELIGPEATFASFGLDSVDGVVMASELETAFAIVVDPALFLRNPTLDEVFRELEEEGVAEIIRD